MIAEIKRIVSTRPLFVAASILLVIATILAVLDRVAAGSLVAGLFVVCVLFHYLPEMESFKAYGVEAKLRAKLGEADDILRKLRQSTLASAKLTYNTLGWGSRMGGVPPKDKQEVADLVDAALLDLNVPKVTLDELKKDYLLFAAYDVFETFDAIVQLNINKHMRPLLNRMTDLGQDESNTEWQDLQRRRMQLEKSRRRIDLVDKLVRTSFRDICRSRLPDAGLNDSDAAILKKFADEVARVVEQCQITGRVVEPALELIASSSEERRRALYQKLFSEEPPG